MREIKFRAWHKEKKCYFEVEDIFFKTQTLTLYGVEQVIYSFFAKIDEVILEQYIELNDKNGKEIYEGDILQYTIGKTKYVMRYIAPTFTAVLENDWSQYIDNFDYVIVVGNIHENGDLL